MSGPDKRADRLAQVTAQVDYHRRRLALYQRLHGSRPSSRLAELEHAYSSACERLSGATAAAPTPRSRRDADRGVTHEMHASADSEEDRRAAVRPPLGLRG